MFHLSLPQPPIHVKTHISTFHNNTKVGGEKSLPRIRATLSFPTEIHFSLFQSCYVVVLEVVVGKRVREIELLLRVRCAYCSSVAECTLETSLLNALPTT